MDTKQIRANRMEIAALGLRYHDLTQPDVCDTPAAGAERMRIMERIGDLKSQVFELTTGKPALRG